MPVDTAGRQYQAMARRWERCRDAYEGSDSIKDKGTLYLPPLDSHQTAGSWTQPDGERKYQKYKQRALWYNATGRTVDGLAGGIFQKAPKIEVSNIGDDINDVTLTNQSAELFALQSAKEVLITGRNGILIDWANEPQEGPPRPYWSEYKAEDIISFRAQVRGGDEVLTRVVLREVVYEDEAEDEFQQKGTKQYRVLELTPNGYLQRIFRQRKSKDGKTDEWVLFKAIQPTRKQRPLTAIPFVFLSPLSVSPWIDKPPLLDLVEVNISHYHTMADLEHGRHLVALPTPWVAGASKSEEGPMLLGAGTLLELGPEGKAGMLEFTGQGLGALERADEQKRHMMAVLGARMLEEHPSKSNVSESATAVSMRHAGEQATLKTLAQSLETGLTMSLQWHEWWSGTAERPSDTGALFELNKDFSTLRMPPEELRALVEALQSGAISRKTFYRNLDEGGLTVPGMSYEDELAQLEKEKGGNNGRPATPDPAGAAEGEVLLESNPYKVVRQRGKFVVVKADTGEMVPGGEHATMASARRHLIALEANVED